MKKVLLIGAGGSIGAILRYLMGEVFSGGNSAAMFSTLTVNVAGCFILSVILSEAFKRFYIDSSIKLGVTTGLLGALTTFSTLCREAAQLIYGGYYFSAALYVAVSALLGIAAVYFGVLVSRRLMSSPDTGIPAEEYRESEEV